MHIKDGQLFSPLPAIRHCFHPGCPSSPRLYLTPPSLRPSPNTFLMHIEDGHGDNLYHCRTHAAGVLRSFHVRLHRGGVLEAVARHTAGAAATQLPQSLDEAEVRAACSAASALLLYPSSGSLTRPMRTGGVP